MAKDFKESMKPKWKFLGGGRILTKKKYILGGGTDIFWNHTLYQTALKGTYENQIKETIVWYISSALVLFTHILKYVNLTLVIL